MLHKVTISIIKFYFRWNGSPRATADFWEARSQWEPTWNLGGDDSHMQIDYVRIWAA